MSATIRGTNFSADAHAVVFFGHRGTRLSDKRWAVDGFEVDAVSSLPDVRECIEGDVRDGNGDKIAELHLSPAYARAFFLEGLLTYEHLKNAAEGPGFIAVPNVEIQGRRLTVRVLKEGEYDIVTADSSGKILPGDI